MGERVAEAGRGTGRTGDGDRDRHSLSTIDLLFSNKECLSPFPFPAGIVADYSKQFVDSDGSVTNYVTTADIIVGAATGGRHSIQLVAASDARVGNDLGRGELNGRNMWLSELLFDPGMNAAGGTLGRTAPHEFGHNAGLNHPAPTGTPPVHEQNLMTQSRFSQSHDITREQLRAIFRNPAF